MDGEESIPSGSGKGFVNPKNVPNVLPYASRQDSNFKFSSPVEQKHPYGDSLTYLIDDSSNKLDVEDHGFSHTKLPVLRVGKLSIPSNWTNGDKSTKTLVLSFVLVLLLLLIFYIISVEVRALTSRTQATSPSKTDQYLNQGPKNTNTLNWNGLQQLENISKLLIQVKFSQPTDARKIDSMIRVVHNGTLSVYGSPHICRGSETPPDMENIVFNKVTHVVFSNMGECDNYMRVIMEQWRFPLVQHLRMHRATLTERNFRALSGFMDAHNETLHRVEINESYLCPSPNCDAGLLNFPNHSFQLIISRRQDNPPIDP